MTSFSQKTIKTMIVYLASALMIFTAPISGHAADEQLPRAMSRAIMPSCEFVYRVELDLAIAFPVDPFHFNDPKNTPAIQIEFKDAWHPESSPLVFTLGKDAESDWYVASFLSMSVSDNHLYREAKFRKGHLTPKGEFIAESVDYQADFGRQFGEQCNRERSKEALFVERAVSVVDPILGWRIK